MIFWILVAVFLTGIALIAYENRSKRYVSWFPEFWGTIISAISGIAIFVALIFMIVMNCGAGGRKKACEEQYKALLYKLESEDCKDEFGLLSKEFVDEIQAWNIDVVKYKEWQRDFWIGIFIPNIYDDFQTINLGDFIRIRSQGGD